MKVIHNNHTIYLDENGKITLAKCNKTGKFIKHGLAYSLLAQYKFMRSVFNNKTCEQINNVDKQPIITTNMKEIFEFIFYHSIALLFMYAMIIPLSIKLV